MPVAVMRMGSVGTANNEGNAGAVMRVGPMQSPGKTSIKLPLKEVAPTETLKGENSWPGISQIQVTKLENKGYKYEELSKMNKEGLVALDGIGEALAEKILNPNS